MCVNVPHREDWSLEKCLPVSLVVHLNTFVECWGARSSLSFNQVLLLSILWRKFFVNLSNAVCHIVCKLGMDTYFTCYLFLHPRPYDLFIHFGELPFVLWCVLQGLPAAWEWAVWLSNFFCMPLDLHQPQATHGYGTNEPASHCSLGLWECLCRGPWGRGEHNCCVLVCPGRKFLTSCLPGE